MATAMLRAPSRPLLHGRRLQITVAPRVTRLFNAPRRSAFDVRHQLRFGPAMARQQHTNFARRDVVTNLQRSVRASTIGTAIIFMTMLLPTF
jgi:hypothetical protein